MTQTSNAHPPTLAEHAEPILQFICSLSIAKRRGAAVDPFTARERITRLLDELQTRLNEVPGGSEHFRLIRSPLVYFVD